MSESFKEYQSLLTERAIILVIAITLIFLWSVNQISFIAVIVTTSIAAGLLVQLEIKRRMENLRSKRVAETEKRKKAKQGSQSLRANALNGVPSAILLIDSNHKIIFANKMAKELLGDGIVDNDAFLYLRQSNFVTALDKVLTGGKKANDLIRYTTSQDRSFDVTVAAVTSTEPGKEKQRQAMVFFYEVTSLLRTEQMRVDFVANASHELRTPLTSITGFIETLLGPAAEDKAAQDRFLGIMQREADRMIRLIDDLLSLSKIEMSRHLSPDSEIDLRNILQTTATTLSRKAAKRGIEFNLDISDDLNNVKADADQITQVLMNLVGNAAKYADQDTKVHISAHPSPNNRYMQVTIRDEGPGISPEHLGRLTERFYRVDTARSRKMGGTGLGLAIVKHILLRHSSQLDIKSTIGEGTSFSFKLPIAK